MSGSTRSPTLADVAEAAGVSLSTASLTFSGNKPVSETTRARVLAAAAALGYTGPNPLARNLRQGRSGVVGIAVGPLSTAFRDPAALPMLDAVSEVLGAAGLGLLLMGDDHARLPLDAVIYDICGRETWAAYDDLAARDVPLVVVEGPDWPGTTFVDIDHRAGCAALATHLHELGHRRVALLTLEPSHPQREREAGVRDVFPDAQVIGACASDLAAAQDLAAAYLATGPDVTAVVCQSDVQAAAVVIEARRLGLAVPDDLSVAGFDGVATPWLDLDAHDRGPAPGRQGASRRRRRPPAHRRRGRGGRRAPGRAEDRRLDRSGLRRTSGQRRFQSVPGGPDSSQDWKPVSEASLIAISSGLAAVVAGGDDVAVVERHLLRARGCASAGVLEELTRPHPLGAGREREDPEPLERLPGVAADAEQPSPAGVLGAHAIAELEGAAVAGEEPSADDQGDAVEQGKEEEGPDDVECPFPGRHPASLDPTEQMSARTRRFVRSP